MPDEFITQRVDIANPPTLMLVIESLLDRITTTASNSQVCMNSIESAAGGGGGVGGVKQALVMEYEEENRGILLFLQDSYPALHEWVTWLRTSQKGGKGVMDGSSNTIIEGDLMFFSSCDHYLASPFVISIQSNMSCPLTHALTHTLPLP